MKKIVLALMGFFCMTALIACSENGKEVAGYIENVKINGILMPAKLDTGADVCSVDAEVLRTYKDGKKTFVEFNLITDKNEKIKLTAQRVRVAQIKLRTSGFQERPVVRLNVTIGSISKDVEVNLANREGFEYRVLLGRNFLEHGVLVDSSQTYIYTK